MSTLRDSSRRSRVAVRSHRAVLFVDYMNAREAAGRLYAGPYAERYPDRNPPTGDFYPRELGQVICDEYNKHRRRRGEPSLKLAEVRVYCGVHDRDRDNPKHIDRLERMRTWTDLPERDAIVSVFPSPIQYSHGWYASEQDRKASVEKEVDTAIAADVVAMALDGQFDVAIVFSGDRDMWPPVYAVLDLTAPGRTIGVYCFGWAYRKDKSVLEIPDGREIPNDADFRQEPLWLKHYIACADDTNYLRRRLQDYPKGAIVTGKVIRQLKTGGFVFAIDHDVLGFLPKGELADDVGNGHLGNYVDQALTVAIKRVVDDLSQLDHGDLPVILSERAVRIDELQRRHDAGEVFDGRVTGSNKGGLLVNVEGVNAFVPLSQIVGITGDHEQAIAQLAEYEGRSLRLKVIKIDRRCDRRDRVILSERVAVQKDRLFDELREGEIREGRITSIEPFGVFVDLGGVDGLAHRSELSWDRNVDPEQMFAIGQEVNVFITKIDKESKKIGLSIRRASPEEGDNRQRAIDRNTQRADTRAVLGDQGETDKHAHAYVHGDFVPAKVTRVLPDGVKVQTIHGNVGDVEKRDLVPGRKPSDVTAEGDILPLVVRLVQPLGLELVEERSEEGRKAKGDGWRFNTDGRLAVPPDDVAKQFQDQHD